MLVSTNLATAIRIAMGFPTPNSTQILGWSSAIVSELQSFGVVNHTLVTGMCPSGGGALTSGAASNGIISGLNGPRLATAVASAAGYPRVSSQMTAFCQEIVSHIMTLGKVNFPSGTITGVCTNTPVSPGILTLGAGSGGPIISLNGSTLASAIHSSVGYPGGVSSQLTQFCTSMVNYIMTNASVIYAPGTVTGVCPAGGGALSSGVATGGTIS